MRLQAQWSACLLATTLGGVLLHYGLRFGCMPQIVDGPFPHEQAALKSLYLAIMILDLPGMAVM